jgi:hypothetical protein
MDRIAELLNKFRTFPRLFAIFYMYLTASVIFWAMGLPDPSSGQWLVAAVTVPAAAFFHSYVNSGTKK